MLLIIVPTNIQYESIQNEVSLHSRDLQIYGRRCGDKNEAVTELLTLYQFQLCFCLYFGKGCILNSRTRTINLIDKKTNQEKFKNILQAHLLPCIHSFYD